MKKISIFLKKIYKVYKKCSDFMENTGPSLKCPTGYSGFSDYTGPMELIELMNKHSKTLEKARELALGFKGSSPTGYTGPFGFVSTAGLKRKK